MATTFGVTGLTPSVAHAASGASSSIVVLVEGPDAKNIREKIVSLVPETLEVVTPEAFSKALRGVGMSKPVGTIILARRNRGKVLDKLRKAAAAVKADTIIFGLSRTNRAGKKEVYVVFIDQGSGDLAVDEGVPMTGSSNDLQKALDKTLSSPLAAITPKGKSGGKKSRDESSDSKASGGGTASSDAPNSDTTPSPNGSDEPSPDDVGDSAKAEPAAEKPSTSDRKPHEIASALVSIELGLEIAGRWFDYTDPVTNNLRPYNVFGPPMVSLSAELYPLAGMDVGVLKGLGITGGYARVFGLDSSITGGDPIATTYERINGALRLRLPFGKTSPVVLGLSGGIRALTFSFDSPPELVDQVPQVSYMLLRGGLDVLLPVGPVALTLGADYLAPLSSGDVYERFADPSVGGVSASAGVIVPIKSGFEVRLLAEYNRFFSSFKPAKGDAYIAGGALDQFLGLRLAGAYVY